jgi:proteasome alpha subunit
VSAPFYVSPEQVMKDRADYARKNLARGRDLVAFSTTDGVVIVTENQYPTLHKISEVYDRIAFGAVGKYNEFEMLRRAGIQQADLLGYLYAREDVNARSLANAYGQQLGQVFTHEMKPYEVEILLAEVGTVQAEDKLYHITYDGTVIDEEQCAVLGGRADTIEEALATRYRPELTGPEAVRLGTEVLAADNGPLTPDRLEVAMLQRSRTHRAFRRVGGDELAAMLAAPPEDAPSP